MLCIEKIHVDRRRVGGVGGVRGEKCSPTSKKETLVIAITQIMRGYAGKCLKSGPDQDKIGDSIEREEVLFFSFSFFFFSVCCS